MDKFNKYVFTNKEKVGIEPTVNFSTSSYNRKEFTRISLKQYR